MIAWDEVVAWQIVCCTGRMADHAGFEWAHPERWAFVHWGAGSPWAFA